MNDNAKDNALWALFLEATDGVQRVQWMLFPPALEAHGADGWKEGRQRFIKRRMEKPGHRAKWRTTEMPTASLGSKLKLELEQYESTGWSLRAPILIALEEDDYAKAWDDANEVSTPYKALRHVEKVAIQRGYRLTN